MKRSGVCLVLICVALAACDKQGPVMPADSLPKIENAWIRAAPPTTRMLAAYLDVQNPGTQELRIVAVDCSGFGKTEMHRSEIQNDVARMIRQDTVTLGAGKTTSFSPGGLHLMLHDPIRPVTPDDVVPCTLDLSNGTQLEGDFIVQDAGAEQVNHANHHGDDQDVD
ncbi:MAG: copper chaperone PCu(A)C [Gammaproteobacteria bacterium]